MSDINQIKVALSHVDNSDRELWIKMGAALKTELGDAGIEIFDDWSQSSDRYDNSSAKSVWKSLKPGFVNIGSLFYEARKEDWRPDKPYTPPSPEQLAERQRKQEAARQKAIEERQKEIEAGIVSSIERWNKAKPVNPEHPYLVKKGIDDPKVLRLIKQEDDKLLIPIKFYGKMIGVQSIDPTGRKLFEKGIDPAGGSLIIGSWDKAKSEGVVIAEGFATAASIYMATGMTSLVGFNGHNMTLAAKALKNTKFPIVIAADHDEPDKRGKRAGLEFAKTAQEVLGDRATIVVPTFSAKDSQDFELMFGGRASDFNDLYQLKGEFEVNGAIRDAYQSLFLESAKEVTTRQSEELEI